MLTEKLNASEAAPSAKQGESDATMAKMISEAQEEKETQRRVSLLPSCSSLRFCL